MKTSGVDKFLKEFAALVEMVEPSGSVSVQDAKIALHILKAQDKKIKRALKVADKSTLGMKISNILETPVAVPRRKTVAQLNAAEIEIEQPIEIKDYKVEVIGEKLYIHHKKSGACVLRWCKTSLEVQPFNLPGKVLFQRTFEEVRQLCLEYFQINLHEKFKPAWAN